MSEVTVTFKYEPEEPDEGDSTGMSNDEYERLTDQIMVLGGHDVEIEKEEGK